MQREENSKSGGTPKHVVADSTDSEEDGEEDGKDKEEHSTDYQKKRHKRTKEDIEREILLMGDLYAILGLEDK
jgi:hypothetical protein